MAFFRQLKLLLWKNGLSIIRQPTWSMTLIAWPLVIFILIAVTRYHFPAFPTNTCYVAPRNLPSTGFFPFLQTVLCNADSHCHNTSQLVDSTPTKSTRNRRSASPDTSPVLQGLDLSNFAPTNDANNDPAILVRLMESLVGSTNQGIPNSVSFVSALNITLTDQEALAQLLESVNVLRKAICTVTLPWTNTEAPNSVTDALTSFCNSNSSLLEVSLQTLNMILTELLLEKPDEVMGVAGTAVVFLNELQNQTAVWENLLAIPDIFSSSSVDQTLIITEALIKNLQSLAQFIKTDFPQTSESLSTINPLLVGGIKVVQYIRNWPGKDVTVTLGDIVTLQNDTIGGISNFILQGIHIPLDKAIALLWDRNIAHSYLCDSISQPMWVTMACSTGTVDVLLSWISPEKGAKQVLLEWSKYVAAADVAFVKELVLSGEQGVASVTRSQRSVDVQPQNSEEELFLGIGEVLLEISTIDPEFGMIVERAVSTVYQTVDVATTTLSTLEEILNNVLGDGKNIRQTLYLLLTNQSEASAWISHVLNSVTEIIMKTLDSKNNSCEQLVEPIEWFLPTHTLKIEVWRSMFCQDLTSLKQALLEYWLPVVEQFKELKAVVSGQAELNATLPMILSEWHKLYNASSGFEELMNILAMELGGAFRMDWIPGTSVDLTGTLLQSVLMSTETFGEQLQESQQWSMMKDYFNIANWILNYRTGVTTQTPNCYVDINYFTPHCDADLNWSQFASAVTNVLTTPSPNALLDCLKGTMHLLQHVYGAVYQNLTASYLKEKIKGEDAISAYLINQMHNLETFVQTITVLPNQNITDPAVMGPLISTLLDSMGLKPLLPLFISEGPFNISTLLGVVSKLGRINQNIFTFNETDPTMLELERLIFEFLSFKGNLTLSLSNVMANSLLSFSNYLSPDYLAQLKQAIQPFTNQNSAGIAEATLSAIELLKTLMDSPNSDPTTIVLGYLHQLQMFILSNFRLQELEHFLLANGQLNETQVTDVQKAFVDFLSFFTSENLQSLAQAGPDAAQDAVIQKFLAILPPALQQNASVFLQDLKVIQTQLAICSQETGQNCLQGIFEIPERLSQIEELMRALSSDIIVKFNSFNPAAWSQKYEALATTIFSLTLSPNNAANVETFKRALYFLRLVTNGTDISRSIVQNALMEANLSLYDLNKIPLLAANTNALLAKVMEVIDAKQCFKPQNTLTELGYCAVGMINKISSFLAQLPAFHNDTAILSLLPVIINETTSDIIQVNSVSSPNLVVAQTLQTILASIKMGLQQNNLSTPDIMNEITVVEGLVGLVTNLEPFYIFNSTFSNDPVQAQKVFLELLQWYLKKLENTTSISSVSELLQPFFYITQMQVASQLAQTEFSVFVSNKVEFLTNTLQYPVDGAGMKIIGQTAIDMTQYLLDYINEMINIQSGNEFFNQLVNTSALHSIELQMNSYLQLIEKWMEQPDIPMLLTSLLQLGNSSMPLSAAVTDLQNLMKTTNIFVTDHQLNYLNLITNVTQSISEAIMVAEQTGSLQSEEIAATLLGAVQILSPYWSSPPTYVQQEVWDTVRDTLSLLTQNLSFASSHNLTLVILDRVETLAKLNPTVVEYLLPFLEIIRTYFESTKNSGTDQWNRIILDEMKVIQSFLPPDSIAEPIISAVINFTEVVLQLSQSNMNISGGYVDSLQGILSQIPGLGSFLSTSIQLLMGGTGSGTGFPNLALVIEQLTTGTANQETWDNLKQMLAALLSSVEGQEEWSYIASVMSQLEKIIGITEKNVQAQIEMMLSLQTPILALMSDIAASMNSAHIDMTELTANGTLGCTETLGIWEPVRVAARLNSSTLALWCEANLLPVFEANAAAQIGFTNLNMNITTMETMSASATADRIVETMQSLYEVGINQTLVIQQFITAVSSQISGLTGLPLSPEAQLYWSMQLQDMQLQHSLMLFQQYSGELLQEAPFLQPYINALVKTGIYVLENYSYIENNGSFQNIFQEAAAIFLMSANLTSDGTLSSMWGTAFAPNETLLADLISETIKLMINTNVFGSYPDVHQALEQFMSVDGTNVMAQGFFDMSVWLTSTQASGLDLFSQVLSKTYDIVRPVLSVLTSMSVGVPVDLLLYEELAGNIVSMSKQFAGVSDLLPLVYQQQTVFQASSQQNPRSRQKRDLSAVTTVIPQPFDDIVRMFQIDYPAMYQAVFVSPTTAEVIDTAHVVAANADLNAVLKGASSNMQWSLNASREATIDATLGMVSFLTHPQLLVSPPMDLLLNATNTLPDGIPYSTGIKNIANKLASESPENLTLMWQTVQTATRLLQISPSDPQFTKQLNQLKLQVCTVEDVNTVKVTLETMSIQHGQLCNTVVPSMQILASNLQANTSSLPGLITEILIGDPSSYNLQSNWSSAFTQILGIDTSSLKPLNISSPGVVTFGKMLRNQTAFILAAEQHLNVDPAALALLMEAPFPTSNAKMLSLLANLQNCNGTSSSNTSKILCSMSAGELYKLLLLLAQHINTEKLAYRIVLSDEIQGLVQLLLQATELATRAMNTIAPAVNQLQRIVRSVQDLNMAPSSAQMRSSFSNRATFVTLSRALCSNGILALFGISSIPDLSVSGSSFANNKQREELIDRFKIPRDSSSFCMNMYLDMVNTTGGAIAWAFLKPMLMGHILFTPDTPITRDIMKKANATLQEFANLKKHSENWIESSNYLLQSASVLSTTLPILQNSLNNPFVKRFIEMQTGINVDSIKATLNNFSNLTEMLEQNKQILNQITTLSTLMVKLSSCIKFDRHRGYNSTEEMDAAAQELAIERELYASVIFKLSNDSSKRRKATSSPSFSGSSLPPKVRYTIRMHMDNVMRTDRVRRPYFVKDTYITAGGTMRYNRGFIYLQENIDRAIIETQTGQKIEDIAVQLQPFPYPCFLRDEFLEAMFFVFPLMLMIQWMLFVADFVKKLVYERELRLHEYMKMMGVNPLSHFFAWFLECTAYLLLTIFILLIVLKCGNILPKSDGFLVFLYLCDYGLSIIAFSFLVSSFFDKTYIAGLSGSLLYVLCFFPFIVVMALEGNLNFFQKSALSLFSPTCFSYACQYATRYEAQGEGIQWSNSYTSPISGDMASFGWLCWLLFIDSILYFFIGGYIRMVFPGKYGIPAPWYFPFQLSFWTNLFSNNGSRGSKGLLFSNIMKNQPVLSEGKRKGKSTLAHQTGEDFLELPVGVELHGLTKMYGDKAAIQNLNISFYESHVTSLLGHNGAGKTTTMSLLTGLYAPTSGSIEVYGKDMQANIDKVRRELGVCMQYDVLFDHMTTKEHLLLYGQIKAPNWSRKELHEQVRTILEETGMYAHRHKRVGTLSGGMKRKLSISIAFIGGSRLVVLDEPTTGVDPCSRRSIWDIVIQHKKNRTIIMSTHHLDEAEVLSDRIAFLEKGGIKCSGSPFYLKDKLGQGYKLTLTKKIQDAGSESVDNLELKSFIQAHLPEARMTEAHGGDAVYSLPPFSSANASSYRSLLSALDANLNDLRLGGYGISDTTLEEVFLHLTNETTDAEDKPLSISETLSDTGSINSFSSDSSENFNDNIKLTSSSTESGVTLACQQLTAMLIKRFHHSRRDWKGLISQVLLPVLFVMVAMGLGSIKSDMQHYPEMELSPALYKISPSYSFFSNQNGNSSDLVDSMMSFPGIDNACLDKFNDQVCTSNTNNWIAQGNISKPFSVCKCTQKEQICNKDNFQPPHKKVPSSQIVYNLSGINVENYLVATANDFIRNRYGGFAFGMPLPVDLQIDVTKVPKNRTLAKVWFNPEGHHTMPAYLNSLNNFILRSKIPADKDPQQYAISVSSHPYFGRMDDEDTVVEGLLQILVAMCVLTGFSIMTSSFALYEVNEHQSGSKRLQHIAGISEAFYWSVNFFYDMVTYLIPVTLTICVIAAFQIPAFTDRQNLGAIALLLVLFGFSTFPWMYLLSGVFRDGEIAFISYVCINLFISINTIMSTSILYFLGQIARQNPEFIQEIFRKLCNAFLIFPQFSFGNGMMILARTNIEVQILSGYGIDAYKNPFSTDGLGWMFISSFIQGCFFFMLRLVLNKSLMRKVRHLILGRKTVPQVAPEQEDEDVSTEHLRVASGAASSDLLQINQLTKVYQHLNKKVHAVKRLSVGIPAGECFGLLGVNGAGKTTTFKMLTGDVSPTGGSARIMDRDRRLVDIMECRYKGINIGYCPQVDALDDLLTGEEHLYFYARIRGISKREIDGVVNYLLKRLELNYHRNIVTDGYSCGTRRKLSAALALIGHPQILLLDEPSSGMDPRTKRHLWKIISEEVRGKCAVVLTSHSMEECEALCSRLAIMVKGHFQCLGSLQHIKNRFGTGFTVKMYLAEPTCDAEAITTFMQHRFPSTYLKDQHSAMVEYHVPNAPGGVADIFNQLETNKNALCIKHFSVSQTTLDEVFINFAMGNIGTDTESTHSEEDDDDDGLDSIKAVQT
nr:glucosylceramide transporter ABCA12 isoform X2 [Nothobranchius furzeri]